NDILAPRRVRYRGRSPVPLAGPRLLHRRFTMETLTKLFSSALSTTAARPQTALLAILLCFCIGHIVAWVYMWTHDGLSYSKMFTMSLLAMPVIVALVMILMAGNIVLAVGLLAVFTVVRFRNVLKDTRDTTFVLWAII